MAKQGAEAVLARSLYVLVVSIAFTIVSALPLFLATAQSTRLQEDLGFSTAGFGVAVSLSFVAAVLSATPIGVLVGRAGPAVGFKLTAVFGAVAMLWLGLVANSWLGLVVGLVVCGVGASFAQVTTSIALAGGVDRRYQGRAFGIKQAAVPVTSLAAGLGASLLGGWIDWRPMFIACGTVALLFVLWRPKFILATLPDRPSAGGLNRWLRYLPFASVGVLAGAIGTFLPTFAVDSAVSFDFSEASAGLLLALGSGGAAVIRVMVGQFVDRHRSNGLNEIAFLSAATIICLGAMAAFSANQLLFAIGLVTAIGFGWGTHGLIPHIGARISLADTGTVMGIATSSVYLGNILGPLITGFMVETSYELAWLFIGALCVISVWLALAMERRLKVAQAATKAH